MTVCIAALCKDDGGKPVAMVAADRMVTLGSFIEFEHSVPKMTDASTTAMVMVAGDTLVGTRIARDVAAQLAGTAQEIQDVSNALAQEYAEARREQLEEQYLRPRALDLQSYYASHGMLSQQIIMMLDNQIAHFNLGVELLLAGVDSTGGHIHTITNPGGSDRLHDVIGYAAAGSGAIHALQSMIGFQHCSTAGYHETLFRVYASKRRAEVAPGVGSDTDMAVITDGGIQWLSGEELSRLDEIFTKFNASTDTALQQELSGFSLSADPQK